MSKSKTAPAEAAANTNGTSQPSNLYISVTTFNPEGKTIGERIVDLYHYGTVNWLYKKHMWWAMKNGHTVEVQPATPEQIEACLAAGVQALADKFNGTPAAETKAIAA